MNGCILLTGGTGFLGAQIARRLLGSPDQTLIALVRAENQAAATRRLARAWWDWPELIAALTQAGRVEVLAGDVSLPHLGLEESAYARLAGRITHIIHTAADLRIDAPLEVLRKTNLQGTANLLELARLAHHDHGLERYAHVSTAYVAGRRGGPIPEADLSADCGFSNAYEQSKYEAERLVQAAKSELPISIFRPGMIVGASDTGEIRTFNTLYYPLRLYLTGKLPVIPASPALPVNLIPVDYVAEAVVRLTFCAEAQGLNFHLTAPSGSLPKAGELVAFARSWARKQLGLRLPRPVFVRLPALLTHAARRSPILPGLSGMLTLLPYFNEHKHFQCDNVDRLLGPYPLDWREYLPRLLGYAVDQGFLHRTDA